MFMFFIQYTNVKEL